MFERFTESARRALFFARYEVSLRGGSTLETEHLLFGLVREPLGIAARILSTPPLSVEAIRSELNRRTVGRTEPRVSSSVEIPFSDESRRAIELSIQEADALHHAYVSVEHMLLGLLREEHGMARAVLIEMGADLATIRDTVQRMTDTTLSPEADRQSLRDAIDQLKGMVRNLHTADVQAERTVILHTILTELDRLRDRLPE